MKFLFQGSRNPHFNFCLNLYLSYAVVIQKLKIQNQYEGNGNHHCKGGNPPAHSPDLAASDFHLVLHVKKLQAGQKFHEDEDVKNKVTMWLCVQVEEFCDIGI
jgi:hypothetical protein